MSSFFFLDQICLQNFLSTKYDFKFFSVDSICLEKIFHKKNISWKEIPNPACLTWQIILRPCHVNFSFRTCPFFFAKKHSVFFFFEFYSFLNLLFAISLRIILFKFGILEKKEEKTYQLQKGLLQSNLRFFL